MAKYLCLTALFCWSMLSVSTAAFGQSPAQQPPVAVSDSAADLTTAGHSQTVSDSVHQPVSPSITLSVPRPVPPPNPVDPADCTACLWYDIILGVLMTALGAFAAVFYEGLGHAAIEIRLDESTDHEYPRHGRVRFLHVAIYNKPRKVPFVTRETAYACEVSITFVSRAGVRIGPMPGRWAGNPEPLRYEAVNGEIRQLPDFALMVTNRLTNIPPLRSRRLDIAMRRAQDREAFGWTDTSYLHDWRQKDFRLPEDSYAVHVEVTTGDRIFPQVFRLENPENIDGFLLRSA